MSMFALLFAIATSAPVSSPAPTPSAAPLKTIVTVRTSPFCSAFASHVNAAIGATVQNDSSLGSVIVALRATDLENNTISRRNELQALEHLADSMYHDYRSGEDEVNRLRDLAKTVTDKGEQAELKASADALGGALYRQHLIQRDLDGFVAYLNTGEMRHFDSDERALMGGTQAEYVHAMLARYMPTMSALPGDESPEDDTRMAKEASRDFRSRLPQILKDEINAGAHIATASERC